MPEGVLQAVRLDHTYGTGRAAVHAVRGVDLTIEPGERLLIMGPSGSGKTTLLSMLGGLLGPTSGQVLLGGESLYDRSARDRAALRLRRIGFVFQSFNLLSALTARENVELPLRLAGVPASQARREAEARLDRLGLAGRAGHRPRDLSGGEKQRVAIARALVNEPDIVMADEPTANLDAASGREVSRILHDLSASDGHAVLIVSHDDRLREIASRVVRVEDGTLSAT